MEVIDSSVHRLKTSLCSQIPKIVYSKSSITLKVVVGEGRHVTFYRGLLLDMEDNLEPFHDFLEVKSLAFL